MSLAYDVMDELRDCVRGEVRMGYTPADQIVDVALDLVDDDAGRERLRVAAEHLLRTMGEAQLWEQAGWPDETDCDRLDRAFQALERRGIVARQQFSCCQGCGSREIWDEVDEAKAAGVPVRGHTYFHQQDTERAAEGLGLYMAFGSVRGGGDAEVGREIVEVLRAHGLDAEWDGSPETRILVPLEWKRRRRDLR